jgi:flagellar capping protein FliD
LSRAAVSSNEQVLTLTNLSKAPTGVYEVEVGSNIHEKIGSKSYKANEAIGFNVGKDKDGAVLSANGKPLLLPFVNEEFLEEHDLIVNEAGYVVDKETGLPPPADEFDEFAFYVFTNDDGYLVDHQGALLINIDHPDYGNFIRTDDNGYPVDDDDKIIYSLLKPAPAPLTITMGGKTLTLDFDPQAKPGEPGVYNGSFTMEDLAQTINATVAADDYNGPKISAEVIFDKTRNGETFSRLVITGGEGGSANHITISDPTNLGMDKTHFDAPVTTSLVGSTSRPSITEDSVYTGNSNKTITFVATSTGTLGEDDITFSWADSLDRNRGSFTIKASDWNKDQNMEIEVVQGLKLQFGEGSFIANEAFTIDCQVPVMQQAADNGLAASDKWIHKGWMDLTSPVIFGSSGRFDFSYAGKNYSVPINDGLGLSGLADAINNFTGNPGVIASVINDGMGTATSYKLVLTGAHTGTEHAIRVLDTTWLNRMDCSPESFEHSRRASNSMTRFDGFPNDGVSWLQRPTNEVGDVIQGTVVNLTGTGKATITIKNNVTEMAQKINSLVESVNLTKSYIKQHTKWGGGRLVSNVLSNGSLERATEGGEANGIMIGNYGFQISLTEMDRLMTRAIFTADDYIKRRYPDESSRNRLSEKEKQDLYEKYLEDNGLIYTRLSDIGIRSDPDNGGNYTIDESRLMECLSTNPEAVIKLFTFENAPNEFPVGTDNREVIHLDEEARPTLSGFAVQLGYRMHDLTRTNDVIDPTTGDVAKPAKGITTVLIENYNGIISGHDGKGGIDAKIARETRRIQIYQTRMEQKFARLETALSLLNGASETLASQLASLNNNSNN